MSPSLRQRPSTPSSSATVAPLREVQFVPEVAEVLMQEFRLLGSNQKRQDCAEGLLVSSTQAPAVAQEYLPLDVTYYREGGRFSLERFRRAVHPWLESLADGRRVVGLCRLCEGAANQARPEDAAILQSVLPGRFLLVGSALGESLQWGIQQWTGTQLMPVATELTIASQAVVDMPDAAVDFEKTIPYLYAAQPRARRRARAESSLPRWMPWVLGACAPLLLMAAGYLGYSFHTDATRSTPVWIQAPGQSGSAPVALGLQVERRGSDVSVAWDRAVGSLPGVEAGIMSITDGSANREIALSPEQLRGGQIVYRPLSANVEFRLTVGGAKRQNLTEAVRVLGAEVANQPLRVERVPEPKPEMARMPELLRRAPVASTSPLPEPGSLGTEPLAVAPALRAHEQALPRVHPPTPAAPVEAAPPPAEKAAATAVAEPVPAPPTSTTINLTAPIPVKRASFPFPPELRRLLRNEALIDVGVSVDAKGRVIKASAVPLTPETPRLLLGLAESAALRWQFTPATHNGQPAPGQTVLHFRVKP